MHAVESIAGQSGQCQCARDRRRSGPGPMTAPHVHRSRMSASLLRYRCHIKKKPFIMVIFVVITWLDLVWEEQIARMLLGLVSHLPVRKCQLRLDGLQPIPPWRAERAFYRLLRTLHDAQKGRAVYLMCNNLLLQSHARLRRQFPAIRLISVWMWKKYPDAQVSHLLY